MKQISFIKSLMQFNKRVLFQGSIKKNHKYTFAELKNKLFFNKVFISNMQEMFQKYDVKSIIPEYTEELSQYISNINDIIIAMYDEKNFIKFSRENSFERRLSIEGTISNHVITKIFDNINCIDFKFINNYIYYLSLFANGQVAISYVDMRSAIYKEVISCQMEYHKLHWKTDDCIRDYIRDTSRAIDTIAIRVTTRIKDNSVSKVEYSGSTEVMRNLVQIFRPDTLIVSNPFIYVDDIEIILDKYIPVIPITKPKFDVFKLEDLFDKDILLEYPNDSFDEYLQFLDLASKSKNVKSIYVTLYRIGKDPAIFYILRDAVQRGIKVYANIELCASGESINMMWMDEMRKAGIIITTYAAGKLKVHCKLTLVEFINGTRLAQIGTGNYHTKTATQYTDLSLITGDENICKQVKKIFNLFSGKNNPDDLYFDNSLLVTRYNAREELLRLIDEEGSKGKNGHIVIKCNSLDDTEFNLHLDHAANNGCRIDLIVRGVCTWVPNYDHGNVMIKSIVWDKLEHSRVFCFGNNNPIIYIGSLDLVTKKIDKRIESLVLIKDIDVMRQLCSYLNRYIVNIKDSWLQTNTGMYIKE